MVATLNLTTLEQAPITITEAHLSTKSSRTLTVQQGDSVNNELFAIFIPGYDWYGDQSLTGLDASLCASQIKSLQGETESDSLLDFELDLQPITFEAGTLCQGWLKMAIAATPTQTLAVDLNQNLEYFYDIQLGFFESVAGDSFIFTSHRGKINLLRKGSEVIA